jgi:hypothetical protein
MKNRRQYESGNAALGIIIVIILIAIGVIVSNYIGPKKGWLSNLINPPAPKPIIEKVVQEKKETPKTEIEEKPKEEKKETTEVKEPEKKQEVVKPKGPTFKEQYEALYKKFRKKFKNPIVGKEYKVYLGSKGKTTCVTGILKKHTPGKIVIKSGKVTAAYPINVVNKRSYPKLFPERAAQMLALNVLKKKLKEKKIKAQQKKEAAALAEKQKNEPTTQKTETTAIVDNKQTSTASKTVAQTSSPTQPQTQPAGPLKYSPSPTPTPEYLKAPLKTFVQWVEMQQRKMHGKIANKVYAKQQGDKVVLYLQPSKLFCAQDYDVRYSVTNGMWQIWGFKCIDAGVVYSPEDAHIVLVDEKNKIIGGSTIKDSSAIWVKRK